MATYSQSPGALDLQFIRGDELNFSAQFAAVDLTSGTLTASVYDATSTTATAVTTPGLSVSVVTSSGVPTTTVLVSLVETQTSSLDVDGRYRWFLRYVSSGGVTRTYLAGNVFASNP
jgi:hypothetical protein